ncbi:MAG: hypothetical protein ABFR19_04595 [Pseudomonadota bacterium]
MTMERQATPGVLDVLTPIDCIPAGGEMRLHAKSDLQHADPDQGCRADNRNNGQDRYHTGNTNITKQITGTCSHFSTPKVSYLKLFDTRAINPEFSID